MGEYTDPCSPGHACDACPSHIHTGDFKINVEAYLSVQIEFPNGSSADCRERSVLRTRRLTSIGGQAVAAPNRDGSANNSVTEGTYLGTFLSKPGHYNFDIEVLSVTLYSGPCLPRLEIVASYYDFNKWQSVEEFWLWFCAFCELLGISMLFVSVTTHFRKHSLEEVRLRIFNADTPTAQAPLAKFKPSHSLPLLLIFGIIGVAEGVVLFATSKHSYDAGDSAFVEDLDLKLQILSLFAAGAGLASLVAYRIARQRRQPRSFLLWPSTQQYKHAWGITGLRLRRFPARSAWSTNPVKNLPTVALVCSLTWFVWLVPMWIVYARGQTLIGSRGLFVSLPRKGVLASTSPVRLTAPMVRIDSKRRIYLNYQQTTWEELPSGLEQELRGLPVAVVYFDADSDIPFMDAARAIDIVRGLGAKAILMTPRSKAEK